MPLSRRAAVKLLAIGATVVAVPGYLWYQTRSLARRALGMSPIDRTARPADTGVFSGDNPERSHEILWNVPAYLKSRGITSFDAVVPDERVPVVVVGGGMSGLSTAYLLRNLQPVVLERADRFGGNAKGESWEGIDYAIGAAYFLEADEGSPLESLYRQWDLASFCRVKTEEDPVLIDGKIYHDFWTGESDPSQREQFVRLKEYFLSVLEETNGEWYPEMPTEDAGMLAKLTELDRHTFREHLEAINKGALHPHIVAVIDHYCWSSLGGSWEEVSAAAGLNFFAAEFGKVNVAPGGNAAVAERVLQHLETQLPEGNLRTDAIVVHVQVRADGVLVAYADASGALRTLLAKSVALCCPKFVVKHILHDIEPARLAAIDTLRYRSYLLANVLLTEELHESFYDLFLTNADPLRATDVVMATYAKPEPGKTVLTLYRGLPYDGARPKILAPAAYETVKAEFDRQIREEILPILGIKQESVAGVRLTRWGHPLPLAAKGFIAAGTPALLRAPFKGRVFFIQQDNWALPAIETALGEALQFANHVRGVAVKEQRP